MNYSIGRYFSSLNKQRGALISDIMNKVRIVAPPAPRRERKRIALSCIPCRVRKIKCDRQLPTCTSCKCRGIPNECLWGDERDTVASKDQGNSASENDALVDDISEKVFRRIHYNTSQATTTSNTDDALMRIIFVAPESNSFNTAEWRQILCLLPDRTDCMKIATHYLRWFEPLVNCMNRVLIIHQLQRFWDVNEKFLLGIRRGSLEVPAESKSFWDVPCNWGFVSVLFGLVHRTACNISPEGQRSMGIIVGDEGSEKIDAYLNGAMYFLARSNHMAQPTLWTLQAMILIRDYYQRIWQARTLAMWTSSLVRLAQTMGLHRLGGTIHDLHKQWNGISHGPGRGDKFTPLEHDFWPHQYDTSAEGLVQFAEHLRLKSFIWHQEFEPGNLAMREIGRKIWHNLVAFDWQASSFLDHCYAVSESNSFTDPPSDIDDDEVLRLDFEKQQDKAALEQRIKQHSFSDNTYLGIYTHIARITRVQVDLENKQQVTVGFSRISESDAEMLDAEYRRVLHYVNVRFNNSGHKPYSRLQREVLVEMINFRILRLHFAYLTVGLRDTEHRANAEACVDAARAVVRCSYDIEHYLMTNHGLALLTLHLFFATLTLHVAFLRGSAIFSINTLHCELCDSIRVLHRLYTNGVHSGNNFLDVPVSLLYNHYIVNANDGTVTDNAGNDVNQEDPLGWLQILDNRDFMLNLTGINGILGDGNLSEDPSAFALPDQVLDARFQPFLDPRMTNVTGFL